MRLLTCEEGRTSFWSEGPSLTVSLLIVAALVVAVFSPCFEYGFLNWDDYTYVTEDFAIRSLTLANIKRIFTTKTNPLTMFSFAVEYKLFGFNPQAYHATNIILHVLNTMLALYIVRLLTGSGWVALFAGALFGIHPMRVESVAWIIERKDVLFSFFYFLSMITYLYYKRGRGGKYYAYCFICFILALLSKSMAVTLPLVLILLDYLEEERLRLKHVLWKLHFFAVSGALTLIAVRAGESVIKMRASPLIESFLLPPWLVFFYLKKIAVPYPLRAFYVYPENISLSNPEFTASVIIALFFLLGAWLVRKREPLISFGMFYFVVTLIPILKFVPAGDYVAADRYTYISSIGIFLAAGIILARFYGASERKWTKILAPVVALCTVAVMGSLAYARTGVWKDSIAFWSAFAKDLPNNPVSIKTLAQAYIQEGKFKDAEREYRRLLDLGGEYATFQFYWGMGELRRREKRYPESEEFIRRALAMNPDKPEASVMLGKVLARQKKNREAIKYYRASLKLNPKPKIASFAHFALGNLLRKMGHKEAAINEYLMAVNFEPNLAMAHYNLGLLYLDTEKIPEAVFHLEAAIDLGYRVPEQVLAAVRSAASAKPK